MPRRSLLATITTTMKSTHQSNARTTPPTTRTVKMIGRQPKHFSLICILVLVSLHVLLLGGAFNRSPPAADARYLPTRADETEVEALKEIIRNLIAKTRAEQLASYGGAPAPLESAGVRPRRVASDELVGDPFASFGPSPLRPPQMASYSGGSRNEFAKLDR